MYRYVIHPEERTWQFPRNENYFRRIVRVSTLSATVSVSSNNRDFLPNPRHIFSSHFSSFVLLFYCNYTFLFRKVISSTLPIISFCGLRRSRLFQNGLSMSDLLIHTQQRELLFKLRSFNLLKFAIWRQTRFEKR